MIERYLQTYRRKGIIVDTNLLLLLIVGKTAQGRVQKFKRTAMYSADDHRLLLRLLDQFETLVATPHILAEVSNLSNGLFGDHLRDFYQSFAATLPLMLEIHNPASEISHADGFADYGLADTGLLVAAKGNYLILTDDLRFFGLRCT